MWVPHALSHRAWAGGGHAAREKINSEQNRSEGRLCRLSIEATFYHNLVLVSEKGCEKYAPEKHRAATSVRMTTTRSASLTIGPQNAKGRLFLCPVVEQLELISSHLTKSPGQYSMDSKVGIGGSNIWPLQSSGSFVLLYAIKLAQLS